MEGEDAKAKVKGLEGGEFVESEKMNDRGTQLHVEEAKSA